MGHPGKYEGSGALGALFDAIALEGFSDGFAGGEDGGDSAELFNGPFDPDKLGESWPEEVRALDSHERTELKRAAFAVLFRSSTGFVDVSLYGHHQLGKWQEIEAEYGDVEPGPDSYERFERGEDEYEGNGTLGTQGPTLDAGTFEPGAMVRGKTVAKWHASGPSRYSGFGTSYRPVTVEFTDGTKLFATEATHDQRRNGGHTQNSDEPYQGAAVVHARAKSYQAAVKAAKKLHEQTGATYYVDTDPRRSSVVHGTVPLGRHGQQVADTVGGWVIWTGPVYDDAQLNQYPPTDLIDVREWHGRYMETAVGQKSFESNARRPSPQKTAADFFYKEAGYSYPSGANKSEQDKARRQHASALARAEQEASERGWEFVWEEDPEGMDTLGDVDPSEVSEYLTLLLKDENGEVLEALGGILMGHDSATNRRTGRLHEAELALEALSRIEGGHMPNTSGGSDVRAIYQRIQRIGPYRDQRSPTPHDLAQEFGLDLHKAKWMIALWAESTGPGGHGEAWFEREASKVLSGPYSHTPNARRKTDPTYPELTDGQREALLAYAAAHGRYWKAELNGDWMRAAANVRGEYRAELQQVRNTFGPSWLHRVTLEEIQGHKANAPRGEVDEHAATELELYMENDARFSMDGPQGQGRECLKNQLRKWRSGRYDHALAPQLWSYCVESAAKAYAQEIGGGRWNDLFNVPTRNAVAQSMADQFLRRAQQGEFDDVDTKIRR